VIKASEIKSRVDELKQVSKEIKEAEELKKKNDRINAEMLEVEKAINKYNRDLTTEGIDKLKNYISVPIIISRDVEEILKDWGYIVRNMFKLTNMSDGEARLYFNEEDFKNDFFQISDNISVVPCKTNLNTLNNKTSNLKTELHNRKVEDECMVTKDDKENKPKTFEDLYDEYMKQIGKSIDEYIKDYSVVQF
jgi:hypothetical protein